jgi:hypothetical protein
MTYRERREAKAERLCDWADGRDAKASAARASSDAISSMIPFGQPILVGHHSEGRHRRDAARIENGMRSSIEDGRKADEMRARAENIERAAAHAIYSDDEDAAERLAERIAGLEAQREKIKAANAAFRKEHRAELKGLTAWERDNAMPHRGYELTNLGGNISRLRKRLAGLGQAQADRLITARYGGTCADCGASIDRGSQIRYSRAAGARCAECPTEGSTSCDATG